MFKFSALPKRWINVTAPVCAVSAVKPACLLTVCFRGVNIRTHHLLLSLESLHRIGARSSRDAVFVFHVAPVWWIATPNVPRSPARKRHSEAALFARPVQLMVGRLPTVASNGSHRRSFFKLDENYLQVIERLVLVSHRRPQQCIPRL